MGKRKKYPHEDLVQEIRKQITSQDYSQISDDMDMYYVEKAGYSPMLRQGETNAEHRENARTAAEQLLEIGKPAADAVAKGLRMQGAWREELLPYSRKHKHIPIINSALVLVAKRQRDPLAARALLLLNEKLFALRPDPELKDAKKILDYVAKLDESAQASDILVACYDFSKKHSRFCEAFNKWHGSFAELFCCLYWLNKEVQYRLENPRFLEWQTDVEEHWGYRIHPLYRALCTAWAREQSYSVD